MTGRDAPTILPLLDAADAALARGDLSATVDALLAAWRAKREGSLAGLLERVSLERDIAALPPFPERFYGYGWASRAWFYTSVHPWSELGAPDPRASTAAVLSAGSVFTHNLVPRWPDELMKTVVAHGDPRAMERLEPLARHHAGHFNENFRALARALPEPATLTPHEAARVRALMAHFARDDDEERALRIAVERDPKSASAREAWRAFCAHSNHPRARFTREHHPAHALQMLALGAPFWLGELARNISAPVMREGLLVECALRPDVLLVPVIGAHPAWATVESLSLVGDYYWARDARPEWWAPSSEPWRGRERRAAAAELIASLCARSLTKLSGAPLEVLESLSRGGELPLTALATSGDRPGPLSEVLRGVPLPALRELSLPLASVTRDGLAWLEHTRFASTLSVLATRADFDDIARLMEALKARPLALPALREVHFGAGDWTLAFTRGADDALSVLRCTLRDGWEVFDSEFQDPPTPGEDLRGFLTNLAPDVLTEVHITSLGEMYERGPDELERAVLRMTRLRAYTFSDE